MKKVPESKKIKSSNDKTIEVTRKINESNLLQHIRIESRKGYEKFNDYFDKLEPFHQETICQLISKIKQVHRKEFQASGDGYFCIKIKLANSKKLLIPIPRKYKNKFNYSINYLINEFIDKKILPQTLEYWKKSEYPSYNKMEQFILTKFGLCISSSKLGKILKNVLKKEGIEPHYKYKKKSTNKSN
ncbi:hypothetical protein EI74_0551 [Mycoplasma testudineum]|uniref:Uncharacterized protein n=1 Tax=Mycoplasma testudineum TaxID=244584 RepID=A0A4R6IE18_9MOLU|nr:hypothetical protein [Mycoplasma testudineum]OYD26775.1 hypothetical protein CG473_02365 [Mycoplasma testudineum]TDO19911.1 hypothetical protein EI74_0551 [Mycoplasma testudineum]